MRFPNTASVGVIASFFAPAFSIAGFMSSSTTVSQVLPGGRNASRWYRPSCPASIASDSDTGFGAAGFTRGSGLGTTPRGSGPHTCFLFACATSSNLRQASSGKPSWNERKSSGRPSISNRRGSLAAASAALLSTTATVVLGGDPSSTAPEHQIHGPGERSRAVGSHSAMIRVMSLPTSRTIVTPAET